MSPPQAQLADKYSRFDAETGDPTHDKDGAELEGKVRSRSSSSGQRPAVLCGGAAARAARCRPTPSRSPATFRFPHTQAKDKARKDMDKARKLREPLAKKLAEDAAFLPKLQAEVDALAAALAALGGGGAGGGGDGEPAAA